MQVGVGQIAKHGSPCCSSLAEQLASEGGGQRQLADAGRAAQHDGVRQAVFTDHLQQALLALILAYHFVKGHGFLSFFVVMTLFRFDVIAKCFQLPIFPAL